MLQPKKLKYRKQQKGLRIRAVATRGTQLSFGSFGLKVMESAWLKDREIESALNALKKNLPKTGMHWLTIFPHKPVSKKPPEVTLGGGKGDLDHYVAVVQPGRIVFEVDGVSRDEAFTALHAASHKLRVRTKIIERGA